MVCTKIEEIITSNSEQCKFKLEQVKQEVTKECGYNIDTLRDYIYEIHKKINDRNKI